VLEPPAARLDWRPSRLLAAVLVGLGLLAGWAVLASEMPRGAAACLAAAALLHGLRSAARECGRAPVQIAWHGARGIASVDGVAVQGAELHWRGPLAFLRWRDRQGHTHRLAFWPDTLDRQQRRALRLAARPAGSAASVEPAGAAEGS
jgi:toxin CptA